MIKAIIFDMDGVLLDSEPSWQKAKIEAMHEWNIEIDAPKADTTIGLRVEDIAQKWQREFNLPVPAARELEDQITDQMIREIRAHAKPLIGVKKTLERLQKTDLKIALASSSSNPIIEAVLETLEIAHYFENVLSANTLKYGKPHPQVYLSTADKLGVLAEECIAIEDSVTGVIAGKAAQMQVVAIPPEELQKDPRYTIADTRLTSLLELPSWLENKHGIMLK